MPPNMATMLSFILTDVAVEVEILKDIFNESVKYSFNRITVDAETSTNDMALIMANGKAQNPMITGLSQDLSLFRNALMEVLMELARMIVRDGEGATKLIAIHVVNAKQEEDAAKVAFSVANSSLVKTAFFGEDCNWGRIVSAIGKSGINIDPEKIDVCFGDIMVVKDGVGTGEAAEKRANQLIKREEITVMIDLNCGESEATVLTTDLSPEYVKINANYRT